MNDLSVFYRRPSIGMREVNIDQAGDPSVRTGHRAGARRFAPVQHAAMPSAFLCDARLAAC